MPMFEARGAAVTVMDDEGRVLGVAYPYGRPLSSEGALAQVGYVADPTAPSGVRRVSDGLAVPTPFTPPAQPEAQPNAGDPRFQAGS